MKDGCWNEQDVLLQPQQQQQQPNKADFARAQVLELSRGMRSRMMASAREMIKKSSVDDPDIWRCARSITEAAVDEFMIDLEHEVERALELAVLTPIDDAQTPGPTGDTNFRQLYLWLRASMLHHYLPFNRSIYGKFKDPVYLVMYAMTAVPIHGVRVAFFSIILLMLVNPMPPDEHQIINFILIFKGMQFLTSGIVYMAKASIQYFTCYAYHKDTLLSCIDARGPGAAASFGQLADYFGSVVLVWIAFSYLPRARKYAGLASRALKRPLVANSESSRSRSRLRLLLHYDVVCFIISIFVLVALTASNCETTFFDGFPTLATMYYPNFHANIFWSCVLYSFLSLPFSLFTVPGLQKVLTHTDPTGYNTHGACVTFALRTKEQVDESETQSSGSAIPGWAARATARVLRTAAKGRTARGGDTQDEYKTGDFARGVWANVAGAFGKKPATSKPEDAASTGPSTDERPPTTTQSKRSHAVASDPGASSNWKRKLEQKAAKFWSRSSADDQAGALSSGPFLQVASVRLVPGAIEQVEGAAYFCIESVQDCSLDGAFGEPWQVMRRYKDFVRFAERIAERTSSHRDGDVADDPAMAAVPALPTDAARGRSWIELEAQRRELDVWLEKILQDPRCHNIWASDVRDFLVDRGVYKLAAPPTPQADEASEVDLGAQSSDQTNAFYNFFTNPFKQQRSLVSSSGGWEAIVDKDDPEAPEGTPSSDAAATPPRSTSPQPPQQQNSKKRYKFRDKVSDAMRSLWDYNDHGTVPGAGSSSTTPDGAASSSGKFAAIADASEVPAPSPAAAAPDAPSNRCSHTSPQSQAATISQPVLAPARAPLSPARVTALAASGPRAPVGIPQVAGAAEDLVAMPAKSIPAHAVQGFRPSVAPTSPSPSRLLPPSSNHISPASPGSPSALWPPTSASTARTAPPTPSASSVAALQRPAASPGGAVTSPWDGRRGAVAASAVFSPVASFPSSAAARTASSGAATAVACSAASSASRAATTGMAAASAAARNISALGAGAVALTPSSRTREGFTPLAEAATCDSPNGSAGDAAHPEGLRPRPALLSGSLVAATRTGEAATTAMHSLGRADLPEARQSMAGDKGRRALAKLEDTGRIFSRLKEKARHPRSSQTASPSPPNAAP